MALTRGVKKYKPRAKLPVGTKARITRMAQNAVEADVNIARKYVNAKPSYKKKSVAKPKNPLSTHVMFGTGFDNTHIMPSPNAIGRFTPINTITRTTVATDITFNTFVVAQFTNSELNLFIINGSTRGVIQLGSGQLRSAAPQEIRILKMCTEVCNSTVFTSIQGTSRTLMLQQPIPWAFQNATSGGPILITAGTLTTITNLMDNHPDVITKSNMEFAKSLSFPATPISNIGYSSYYDFFSPVDAVGGQQSMSMVNPAITPGNGSETFFGPPPHTISTFLMELRPTTVAQNFDFAVKMQVAAKFDASNILSNLSVDPTMINQDGFHIGAQLVHKTSHGGIDTAALNNAVSTIQRGYRNSNIRAANRQSM